jgi:ribosomal protein S18 acetylase RimI-like enzyme
MKELAHAVNEQTQGDPLRGFDDSFALDNVVWASLTGPHSQFATTLGHVARYPGEISPFVALAPNADESVWGDLTSLFGTGGLVVLVGVELRPPAKWEVLHKIDAVQMTSTNFQVESDSDIVRLNSADVPEMLELVERTKPGPFLPRTIELGSYFGIRRDGVLIAMAGERLHPPGWTEISAVCTDVEYRGQGLAGRLMKAVGAGIVARGERPLLHAASDNTKAIRLYQDLGFSLRRHIAFEVVRIQTD